MSEMFAYHATIMSNTLGTSIVVFTRTGFRATLLSHYRPSGTIFAFTNELVSSILKSQNCYAMRILFTWEVMIRYCILDLIMLQAYFLSLLDFSLGISLLLTDS